MLLIRTVLGLSSIAMAVVLPAQTTLILPAAADATLYEDSSGALASGSGDGFFVGRNARDHRRRSLLRFDLSSVPTGSRIVAVELRLFVSRTSWTPTLAVGLYRLQASWGEAGSVAGGGGGAGGSALPGDATWLHRSWPATVWAAAGGDHALMPSAMAATPPSGTAVWSSTPQLVLDVQTWLEHPANNFGWLLKTDEMGTGRTRRFDSREHTSSPQPPELQVTFLAPGQIGQIGPACGSPPLALAVQGAPVQGTNLTFQVAQGPPGALAAVLLGVDAEPQPVGPNCLFWPRAPVTTTLHVLGSGGAFAEVLAVPVASSLQGLPLVVQALSFTPGSGALGASRALLAIVQ